MSAGKLPIGAIVGPQGVRGQFKVKPFTVAPKSLSAYGPVTTDNGQRLVLQIISVNAKGLAIVRAKGVDTRDAAEVEDFCSHYWESRRISLLKLIQIK